MRRKPEWWDRELELDQHILKRMEGRDFTEMNVRTMLQNATSVRRSQVPAITAYARKP